MSAPCPEPMELFQWLDGEVTTNRARELESHVAGCPHLPPRAGRAAAPDRQAARALRAP